jgi:hypothetical protein
MKGLRKGPASGSCLIIELAPRIALASRVRWPVGSFTGNGKYYGPLGFGHSTGFYDWLRDSTSNLVGVRYWPFEDTQFLLQEVAHLRYVKVAAGRLEIYFHSSDQIDQENSADQDFLYCELFRSDERCYAIAFGLENLNESELASLEKAEGERISISPI